MIHYKMSKAPSLKLLENDYKRIQKHNENFLKTKTNNDCISSRKNIFYNWNIGHRND